MTHQLNEASGRMIAWCMSSGSSRTEDPSFCVGLENAVADRIADDLEELIDEIGDDQDEKWRSDADEIMSTLQKTKSVSGLDKKLEAVFGVTREVWLEIGQPGEQYISFEN